MPELKFFWDYMSEQLDRIRRVVAVFDEQRAKYALIGGHAVSYYSRSRTTVDADFILSQRAIAGVAKKLPEAGFLVEQRGEVVRAWDAGADIAVDEPVVDLVPAEYNATQAEALRSAVAVKYQGISLRIITRAALVALKYLSATSERREIGDKLQDIADIDRVVKKQWTDADAAEARRLVDLTYPGTGRDLDRLIDDLMQGRKITI